VRKARDRTCAPPSGWGDGFQTPCTTAQPLRQPTPSPSPTSRWKPCLLRLLVFPASVLASAAAPPLPGSLWEPASCRPNAWTLLAAPARRRHRGGSRGPSPYWTRPFFTLRLGRLRRRSRPTASQLHCVANAPTADHSNIIGVTPRSSPASQPVVKSTCRGLPVINHYLVLDLSAWASGTTYGDGLSTSTGRCAIDRGRRTSGAVRHRLRSRAGLAGRGPRRAAEVDRQAQSLNIYMAGARAELDETYKLAWLRGLKTTYTCAPPARRRRRRRRCRPAAQRGDNGGARARRGAAAARAQIAASEAAPATGHPVCAPTTTHLLGLPSEPRPRVMRREHNESREVSAFLRQTPNATNTKCEPM